MNRRSVLKRGLWGAIAMLIASPGLPVSPPKPVQSSHFSDVMKLNSSVIKSAYARGFQLPSTSSPIDLIETLYWIVGLGIELRAGEDAGMVVDDLHPRMLAWYAADNADRRTVGSERWCSTRGRWHTRVVLGC